MSKKSKNRSDDKQKTAGKASAQRLAAIESTLAKLLAVSDKVIARQKNAKHRSKRLAKDHRVLQERLDGVELQVAEQLQRIRAVTAKNSALQTRLETESGIIKDNCARLSELQPGLSDNQQRSQQIAHQITGLIKLSEKIKDRSDALEQGLAALEQRVEEKAGNVPAAPTIDFEAAAADATARDHEQRELLDKLQARLIVLEGESSDLAQGNRTLAQSIDDLSAKAAAVEARNRQVVEKDQALETGRAIQQSKIENHELQIDGLSAQIDDIASSVALLTNELAETRGWRQQDLQSQHRLAQRFDNLEQGLEDGRSQELESLKKLGAATQQQLQNAVDREGVLKQQVDHLGGLLVTTEGQLTEQSAQLALEDARLAQQLQLLEQRLTAFEGATGERRSEDLASLRSLGDDVQQRLQQAGDRQRILGQQLEDLDSLLSTTRDQLNERAETLAAEDKLLQEKAQSLEQRVDDQGQQLQERLSKELQSITGLTGIMQQQLRKVGERAQSLRQQVDGLETLLQSTGEKLDQQNNALTEKTTHWVSGQKALTVRQDRLSAGLLAAGLLIFALALGGYWLIDQRFTENQSASTIQLDEIRQRILLQEQALAQQQAAAEATGTAEQFSAQLGVFETRLAEQERLIALLEGQRDKEFRSTQGALEKLRQGIAQQKQLISLRTDDLGRLSNVSQQLQAAQQENERLLQRVAAEQSQQRADSQRLADDLKRVTAGQEKREPQAPPAPMVEGPSDALHGIAWLSGLNPQHYIIQLVAAHNRAVIERAAADSDRAGQLAYYKGQFQGRDWYVLLYGDFPSRQQARSASGALPESIRRFKPWIRRVSSVQSELKGR